MKSRSLLFTLALCLLAPLFAFAADASDDASLTGRQIIDEMSKRHDAPFEYETQKMTLLSARGGEEVRDVRRYSREFDDGLYRYLIVFDAPAGVKGVAMLTWQNRGSDDDQWLFMPAMSKKLKRVAQGSKKSYFMGTDYANEDLVSEAKDDFRYDRKPDAQIDGTPVFVVEAHPVAEDVIRSTGYKYRVLYLRKDLYFVIQTDYYNKRGKLFKRQNLSEIVQIEGAMHRARISVMENLRKKHKTRIEVLKRDFSDAAVPESYFKSRFITRGKYMKVD